MAHICYCMLNCCEAAILMKRPLVREEVDSMYKRSIWRFLIQNGFSECKFSTRKFALVTAVLQIPEDEASHIWGLRPCAGLHAQWPCIFCSRLTQAANRQPDCTVP